MTFDIAMVLIILVVSFVLFVTEWLRMDLVALLVLGALALGGLVGPTEALEGFSNSAVVTVWAMFMLSAAMTQTGVADTIGKHVLRLASGGEARMVAVIMLSAALLSAFMNNIGVAALMLPIVMDIARSTGTAPSRLLMPLAFGTLLGGLTTLIGTPPNLLASDALSAEGLAPFRLFDFTPVGGVAALVAVSFVSVWGRRLLPERDPVRDSTTGDARELLDRYALAEFEFTMWVPSDSPLVGRTLAESRIGSAAGLNVTAVRRASEFVPAPGPSFTLRADDRLEVQGKADRLEELRGWRELEIRPPAAIENALTSDGVRPAELRVAAGSRVADRSISEIDFRERFGVIVLALRRDPVVRLSRLADAMLRSGDHLLVLGSHEDVTALIESPDFERAGESPDPAALVREFALEGQVFVVEVPQDSILAGRSLADGRLGDALGLGVVGIERRGVQRLVPAPDEILEGGDRLLVRGRPEDFAVFRGLQGLRIEAGHADEAPALVSGQNGLVEVTLSPRGTLSGKTLRQIGFRSRFGLWVLAIQREGRAEQTNLRDITLQFGDLLLLYGSRERITRLAREADFVVLTQEFAAVRRTERAPLAALLMAGVLLSVVLGWLPISIAALVGASLMVLTRCLTMDEAYRAVEWRSIFLIAGMLPLGTAMRSTGAAAYLADRMLELTAPVGPWGVVIGLYVMTAAATMVIPTAALVVLMAPIALRASADLGISPQAAMMAVAIAASASFTSPISHPANVLVMGPGGYRFVDYFRLGVPLTLLVGAVALLLLPWVWPL